jgi:hypothetical protein
VLNGAWLRFSGRGGRYSFPFWRAADLRQSGFLYTWPGTREDSELLKVSNWARGKKASS